MNGSLTIAVYVRVRGLWLMRLAIYSRSIRLMRWAASRVRVESRAGNGPWTEAGRLSFEVKQ